jgi:hypothetical protein
VRRHAALTTSATIAAATPPTSSQENVTDHASTTAATSGKVRASVWRWPDFPTALRTALGVLVCRWCGRVGRWLHPFFAAG